MVPITETADYYPSDCEFSQPDYGFPISPDCGPCHHMKLVWLLVVGVASVAADKKEKTAARAEIQLEDLGVDLQLVDLGVDIQLVDLGVDFQLVDLGVDANWWIWGWGGFPTGGFGGGHPTGGFGGVSPIGGFGGVSPIGGFGGGLGGGSPVNPPSGCRYWCRTPKGQAYCCENVNEPQSFAGVVKPGQCPPVRPVCPLVKSFGPPSSCSNDGACGGVDKCCFDTCLQQHTCKAPYGFGR
ncbi:uncharacterized protein LOC121864278 [Homarus americanus]|uniref:uncharacterized protein LOC121864278 n=1 Tax=Homarus americanus TaxID=6706 RepID=UPI001C45E9BC|nr:uncharacterized protein LOC121864278 [Homarus americanus]